MEPDISRKWDDMDAISYRANGLACATNMNLPLLLFAKFTHTASL